MRSPACGVAQLCSFECCPPAPAVLEVGPHRAAEDKWLYCYRLTNQDAFEVGSIAPSDLLLINAVPL